jgi:hypothetical protein
MLGKSVLECNETFILAIGQVNKHYEDIWGSRDTEPSILKPWYQMVVILSQYQLGRILDWAHRRLRSCRIDEQIKKTPRSESARELSRPSDRHLSAK